MVCLVLQAAGGAMSTTSSGNSKVGVNLALAGLSLQVIVLFAFSVCFADYMVRYLRYVRRTAAAAKAEAGRSRSSSSSSEGKLSRRVRLFFSFLVVAIVFILARCAYRVDELSEGYDGPLIRNEGLFIALEGV